MGIIISNTFLQGDGVTHPDAQLVEDKVGFEERLSYTGARFPSPTLTLPPPQLNVLL